MRGAWFQGARGGSALAGVPGILGVAAGGAAFAFFLGDDSPAMNVVGAGVVVAWAGAGALLVRRPTTRMLGRAIGPLALAIAAALLGMAAGDADLRRALAGVVAGVIPAAALHLALAMPGGSLASNGRRVVAAIGYAGAAGVAWAWWAANGNPSAWPAGVLAAFAAVSGGPALAARTRRGSPGDHRRLKWLSLGVVLAAGLGVGLAMLTALVSWPPNAAEIAVGASAAIPIALALSSVDRLDPVIDRLLTTAFSVAGLAALVGAVYVVIVLGLGRAPRPAERTLLTLSMVAAGMIALLYIPTRARLTQFATRFVYGERHAPGDVIRSFGSRLSRAVPMDELLLQMAESLRKTMALDAVEVWTGSGGRLERTVSDPDRGPDRVVLNASEQPVVARAGVSGPAWMKVWLPHFIEGRSSSNVRIAPVTHSGNLLGLIFVERTEESRPLTEDDERTLTELARQIGLALHNVQLDSALQASLDEVRRHADALQASRKRIVATADAERRRIERNLHDGAQQHLVALAVKVRLARQLAESNPAQSTKMLEELSGDVQATLDELRALAHGIYPPILADRGLPNALGAAADRSPLQVSVDADGVGRFPQEIEAAVYFCSLEALQNAGKYAGENAAVRIRVWEDAGALLFEVSDNGAGFDTGSRAAGAGFTNMSDRLGAIGGTLRVESAPGRGTKVSGMIPVPAEPPR